MEIEIIFICIFTFIANLIMLFNIFRIRRKVYSTMKLSLKFILNGNFVLIVLFLSFEAFFLIENDPESRDILMFCLLGATIFIYNTLIIYTQIKKNTEIK